MIPEHSTDAISGVHNCPIDAGWDQQFQQYFDEGRQEGELAARVINRQKGNYTIFACSRTNGARLSGKFHYESSTNVDYPVVGDWVAVRNFELPNCAVITRRLARKSFFARKQSISGGRKIRNGIVCGGSTEEQVIAANMDTIFIVTGLDDNFRLSRIERYLTLAYESGAEPVIILNKADLCASFDEQVENTRRIAGSCAVHGVSAATGFNMDIFSRYLLAGKTVVFLGSSGVGKSTLINTLFGGEILPTSSVSEITGKGRHTTTWSDLIFHRSGAMLIDTPGTRELQLWADGDAVELNFRDIADLAKSCRFRNCSHGIEPGCAVRQAVLEGVISPERIESYRKQHTEVDILAKRREQYDRYQNRKAKRQN